MVERAPTASLLRRPVGAWVDVELPPYPPKGVASSVQALARAVEVLVLEACARAQMARSGDSSALPASATPANTPIRKSLIMASYSL